MAIKVSSAKAKGRAFQREVVDGLKTAFNLEDSDVVTSPASVTGVDIILSNKAKELFPFSVECKRTEKLDIWGALAQAEANGGELQPLLVFRRNNSRAYAVLELDYLVKLMQELKRLRWG